MSQTAVITFVVFGFRDFTEDPVSMIIEHSEIVDTQCEDFKISARVEDNKCYVYGPTDVIIEATDTKTVAESDETAVHPIYVFEITVRYRSITEQEE
jgi:hypothetical protein